jgi:hypothetical protein
MFTLRRHIGRTVVAAALGLVVLAPNSALAQVIQPGFQIRPSVGLNQAFINQGLTGQIFPGVSPVTSFPFLNPLFNPAANPLVNPFINPNVNPAINPAALNNFFNPTIANPFNPNNPIFTNPLFGASIGVTGGATSPAGAALSPYAAAASLQTNAYNAATLSTNPYGAGAGGYDPYSGYGSPYYGSYESPVAGYLRGTADMITAQGKWMKDLHSAGILKEQNKQAMVDTRKKIFDEWLYERKNTPTPEDDRQLALAQELHRSLNNPPLAEIISGQALNNILTDLSKVDEKKGGKGPQIPLDEDVLRHLNLTSGGAGNPGLLKNEGRLTWPLALRGDEYKKERELLDSLAPDAIRQAIGGKVDGGVLRDMTNSLASLRQKLTENIRDLTPNQYVEASRFLSYFDDAVKLLSRPNAGEYFTKNYAGKGMTVGELVKFMASKGLTFAPAVTGDESAYLAVHRALVAYDLGAKSQMTSER